MSMFGILRFFLASLVVISHTGINLQGVNPGVVAVVIFYILAGLVVSSLFSKVFISKKPLYLKFYYERILRIFPQYIFIISLTLLFIGVTNYGSPQFHIIPLINNMFIVPLNYYMFIDNSILQEPKWWLIPPAWSLGTELQAYLILPFVIYFKPVKILAAIISLCVFYVASLGFIHSDYFGYRLLPGVLFIFILGTSIYKNNSEYCKPDLFDKYFPVVVYIMMVLLLIGLGLQSKLLQPYVRETIFGIIIGIPIVTYLVKSTIKVPMNHYLGDLSYGLFLSHFLAIWIIDYYFLIDKTTDLYFYIFILFTISLSISTFGIFIVEKNIKSYRFNLSNTN